MIIGSPVPEVLRALETKGLHLVICSTCLNYSGLEDQVEAGIVGGLTWIISTLLIRSRAFSPAQQIILRPGLDK